MPSAPCFLSVPTTVAAAAATVVIPASLIASTSAAAIRASTTVVPVVVVVVIAVTVTSMLTVVVAFIVGIATLAVATATPTTTRSVTACSVPAMMSSVLPWWLGYAQVVVQLVQINVRLVFPAALVVVVVVATAAIVATQIAHTQIAVDSAVGVEVDAVVGVASPTRASLLAQRSPTRALIPFKHATATVVSVVIVAKSVQVEREVLRVRADDNDHHF